MFEIIMLALSIAVFISSIVWAIIKIKSENNITNNMIGRFIICIALSIFPLYFVGNAGAQGGWFDAVISSFLGVVRVASGENSLADTREVTSVFSGINSSFLANYTAILHFALATLVLGFIAGLFKNFYSKIIYMFFENGRLYVFSDISDRSVLLAEDIKKHKKNKCVIVFLGKLSSQNDDEYTQRIAKINAHIFDVNTEDLKLYKRFLQKQVYFFLLKQNEEENLKDALVLADRYKNYGYNKNQKFDGEAKDYKEQIHVYVLNSYDETVATIDAITHPEKRDFKMSFRIINETKALVYSLLNDKPLFLGAKDNKLKILIVGGGRIGTAAAEISAWCGQTVKLSPEIVMVDNDATWLSRLEYRCPEFSPNTTSKLAKEECKISFCECDVLTKNFVDVLKANPDVGYIVCALGDNELNIKTALKISQIYEELRYSSGTLNAVNENMQIHVLIDDPFLYEISKNLKFENKNECEIKPFGSLKKLYTYDNIVSPYFNSLGVAINRFYEMDSNREKLKSASMDEKAQLIKSIEKNADEYYNKKEYNRVASIASGVHFKYKMYSALCEIMSLKYDDKDWVAVPSDSMIAEFKKALSSAEIVEELSILEHRRWNMYMRAQGWSCVDRETADNWYGTKANTWRNFTSKLTTCLVGWDELELVDKWLADKHGIIKDFKETDRIMVRDIATVMQNVKAIELEEKGK